MKFDDLIETIDMLDADAADEVIDWQMTKSPAAQMQYGFNPNAPWLLDGSIFGVGMDIDISGVMNAIADPVGSLHSIIVQLFHNLCGILFPGQNPAQIASQLRETLASLDVDDAHAQAFLALTEGLDDQSTTEGTTE